MQDMTTTSVTGVDGAFMPATKGTSQTLVSRSVLLHVSHCHYCGMFNTGIVIIEIRNRQLYRSMIS